VARSTADEWDKIIPYPSKYRPADQTGEANEAAVEPEAVATK
jgi:hypothetical protein